jgi:hypothetical protein
MKPSTTGAVLIASANTWSFDGSFSISCRRPARASAFGQKRSVLAGDMRSGSGNTMSKPIAAAPFWPSLVTRSASTVRGHGHCPTRFSDSSSISTTRTGREGSNARGLTR